jgi:hypothetical protein
VLGQPLCAASVWQETELSSSWRLPTWLLLVWCSSAQVAGVAKCVLDVSAAQCTLWYAVAVLEVCMESLHGISGLYIHRPQLDMHQRLGFNH